MNYTLIKSADFCGTPCDIYSDDNNEMFMTAFQLGSCLEYANPQKAIDNLISRNEYLKTDEFSVTLKMRATDGKQYDTRIFTEDGIYEVTMLAKTEKAKEFRAFVRKLIKSIRKGETVVIDSKALEIKLQEERTKAMLIQAKADRATAMRLNAENRRLKLLFDNPQWKDMQLSGIGIETLGLKKLEEATGTDMGNALPQTEKTWSATEIGKDFGVSAQAIGKKANALGIKTSEYGITVLDKARHSNKEVPTFRYNQKGYDTLAKAFGVS